MADLVDQHVAHHVDQKKQSCPFTLIFSKLKQDFFLIIF